MVLVASVTEQAVLVAVTELDLLVAVTACCGD